MGGAKDGRRVENSGDGGGEEGRGRERRSRRRCEEKEEKVGRDEMERREEEASGNSQWLALQSLRADIVGTVNDI